jgi:tRNA (guanine37-N1)-methyltransferase
MPLRGRLKKKLADTLPPQSLSKVYSAFDLIGDIAVIKIAPDNQQVADVIASQIMQTHKGVRTVLSPTSAVKGEHRIRTLQVLAGENRMVAKHKEAGCVFSVDLEKCYFSTRLSGERLRIARQVSPGEVVINMFAGVGCFSILIARKVVSAKVYSIDINPSAYQYMLENIRVNRVYSRVIPILGDAKEVIETQLLGVADRILMPLPEKALEYLPIALAALKKNGGWIHFHYFTHADPNEDPIKLTESVLKDKLESLGVNTQLTYSRVVRSTGPNWYQVVVDAKVFDQPSKF